MASYSYTTITNVSFGRKMAVQIKDTKMGTIFCFISEIEEASNYCQTLKLRIMIYDSKNNIKLFEDLNIHEAMNQYPALREFVMDHYSEKFI